MAFKRGVSKKFPWMPVMIVAAVGAGAYFLWGMVNKNRDKPLSGLWLALGLVGTGGLALVSKKTRAIGAPLLLGGAFLTGMEGVKKVGMGRPGMASRWRSGQNRPAIPSVNRPASAAGMRRPAMAGASSIAEGSNGDLNGRAW